MTRLIEPSKKELAEWKKWLKSRPENVRKIAERFDPWSLYRMKETDQIVTVVGFFEDGTIRVHVSEEHNPFTLFERTVFGIDPDDLEPAALSGTGPA